MPKDSIIVGMSGGVDSSVAAMLLREHYQVQGVFMQNWQSTPGDNCSIAEDFHDAEQVAEQLGIPISSINFINDYWDKVFQVCLNEFEHGNTPIQIYYNKEIKFKCFLDYALAQGVDKIATGHYARVQSSHGQYYLLNGKDTHKDQSYFLHRLTQKQLSHCLFPLGELTKPDIRQLAKAHNLATQNKKDSTGICFIGEKKFKPFLSQFFLAQPGDMITEQGKVVGQHDGLMFYTLGQRKGLKLGGMADQAELPWYVIDKNLDKNTLIVGQGHDHPRLLNQQLVCHDIHWITKRLTIGHSTVQIRYRQADSTCSVHLGETSNTLKYHLTNHNGQSHQVKPLFSIKMTSA